VLPVRFRSEAPEVSGRVGRDPVVFGHCAEVRTRMPRAVAGPAVIVQNAGVNGPVAIVFRRDGRPPGKAASRAKDHTIRPRQPQGQAALRTYQVNQRRHLPLAATSSGCGAQAGPAHDHESFTAYTMLYLHGRKSFRDHSADGRRATRTRRRAARTGINGPLS
jgi:hypothetical protein